MRRGTIIEMIQASAGANKQHFIYWKGDLSRLRFNHGVAARNWKRLYLCEISHPASTEVGCDQALPRRMSRVAIV
jgi:hypothetical protein